MTTRASATTTVALLCAIQFMLLGSAAGAPGTTVEWDGTLTSDPAADDDEAAYDDARGIGDRQHMLSQAWRLLPTVCDECIGDDPELTVARYVNALAVNPRDGHALHALGVLRISQGHHDVGMQLLSGAFHVDPTNRQYFEDYVDHLVRLGWHATAMEAAQRCARLLIGACSLRLAEILWNTSGQEQQLEAIEVLRDASVAFPHSLEFPRQLGRRLLDLHRDADALSVLGNLETRLADSDDSTAVGETLYFLGIAFYRLDREIEAVDALRRAVKVYPTFGAWNALGTAALFASSGGSNETLVTEALNAWYAAVELNSHRVDVWLSIADVKLHDWQIADACESFRRAAATAAQAELAGVPSGVQLTAAQVSTIGTVRCAIGAPMVYFKEGEAEAYAERQLSQLRSLLLKLNSGDLGGLQQVPINTMTNTRGFESAYSGVDVRPIRQLANEVILAAVNAPPAVAPHALRNCNSSVLHWTLARGQGGRRLRVGFVSSLFWEHTVGMFISGVIASLDRDLFDVTVAFVGKPRVPIADAVSQKRPVGDASVIASLARRADTVLELSHSLEGAVVALQAAELDIVIFPECGMDDVVALLALHRSAPVQAAWWGHLTTSGVSGRSLDYFIASSRFLASEKQRRPIACLDPRRGAGPCTGDASEVPLCDTAIGPFTFSERRLVCMTSQGARLRRPPTVEERQRDEARTVLQRQGIGDGVARPFPHTYFVPQFVGKFSVAFDAVLTAVLERDPLATVVLTRTRQQHLLHRRWEGHPALRNALSQRRLVVVNGTQSLHRFLGVASYMAVAIDPFPVGGGRTTMELLSVGTPVVTCPSCLSVFRFSAGLIESLADAALTAALIAQSAAELADKAVAIAALPLDQATALRSRVETAASVIFASETSDAVTAEWERFLLAAASDASIEAQRACAAS